MQPPFPSPTPTWHNETYSAISPLRPESSVAGKNVIITGAVKWLYSSQKDYRGNWNKYSNTVSPRVVVSAVKLPSPSPALARSEWSY